MLTHRIAEDICVSVVRVLSSFVSHFLFLIITPLDMLLLFIALISCLYSMQTCLASTMDSLVRFTLVVPAVARVTPLRLAERQLEPFVEVNSRRF